MRSKPTSWFGWLACLSLVLSVAAGGCGGDPYAEVPVDVLRERAATELGYFNFETSRDMYRSIMNRPDFTEDATYAPEVFFGIGTSYQQISPVTPGNIEIAEEYYQQVIDTAPRSELAARAALNLARIAELRDYQGDEPDLQRARDLYRQVAEQWADMHYAGEAVYRLGASYIATFEPKQIERGMTIYKDWLAEHPDEPMASAMWQYMANTYLQPLEDYDAALQAYIKADQIGLLEKGTGVSLYWKVARIADELVGDVDTAIYYYRKIIIDTPNSGFAYEAQLALEAYQQKFPDREIEIPEIRIYRALEDVEPATDEATSDEPPTPDASPEDRS